MKKYRVIGVSLAAMVVLAGCTDFSSSSDSQKEFLSGNETLSGSFGGGPANFGNATRSNMATQIVDPAPANVDDPPKADGQVIIGAYGRYRTDKVKPPEPIGTF